MESTNSSSPIARLIPVLIFFAGLIGIYYLYQYLYAPKTGNSFTLLAKNQSAQSDPAKPIIITSDALPGLYEGGEFSVSTWVYVNDWSHRKGYNKAILNVGGKSFDTMRIYLGGYKPKLYVRFHTKDGMGAASTSGAVAGGSTGSGTAASATATTAATTPNQEESLAAATLSMTYDVLQTDSGMLDSAMCDLPEIELQRWINITVTANGRTVDVYLDGKLARSCVLPSTFKVDSAYSATLLYKGGFGGHIASTVMYDAALNPEQVYKNYIAGPEPITTFTGWISSFFAPAVDTSTITP